MLEKFWLGERLYIKCVWSYCRVIEEMKIWGVKILNGGDFIFGVVIYFKVFFVFIVKVDRLRNWVKVIKRLRDWEEFLVSLLMGE